MLNNANSCYYLTARSTLLHTWHRQKTLICVQVFISFLLLRKQLGIP